MGFVRVPGNPEPEGAEAVWYDGRGGLKLRVMLAPALGSARGSVLVFPGRTEFIEKYFELACELQERGFAVLTPDWRGQGLSDRELPDHLKGHLETFDDPVTDLFTGMRLFGERLPRPHIAVAHSMGAAIALRALQTNRIVVEGALFSAPMWGVPQFQGLSRDFLRVAGALGFGARFCPGVEQKWRREAFKRNRVTHDQERFARAQGLIAEDPRLALAGPTIGWAAATIAVLDGFRAPGALNQLRIPTMTLAAAEEFFVDNRAVAAVTGALPTGRLVTIPGARHELIMETDTVRAQWWSAFDTVAGQVAARQAVSAA